MFILLKRMLDKGIKLTMAEQITTLENIFTLKMENLLIQRIVLIANTQTGHMELGVRPPPTGKHEAAKLGTRPHLGVQEYGISHNSPRDMGTNNDGPPSTNNPRRKGNSSGS